MSVKLASFMFENERYFVCLDGGYLQGNFEGKNAVTMADIGTNFSYKAAIAQSWGKSNPVSCPVSEDAEVTKVGDKFVVHGTCGEYTFNLTEDSYTCEKQIVEEPAPVSTLDVGLSEDEVRDLMEIAAAINNDNSSRTNKKLGSYGICRMSRNGTMVEYSREPKAVVVNNVVRPAAKFRGMKRMPAPVKEDIRLTPRSKPDSDRLAEITTPVQDKEEQNGVGKTAEALTNRHTSKSSKPSGTFTAPSRKVTRQEFNAEEFLNSLADEQRALLESAPETLLRDITNFTRQPINMTKLESQGAVYCVNNKWALSGDWYAVDDVPNLSRVFYCSQTNEVYTIPVKTIKNWLRCKEAQLVG